MDYTLPDYMRLNYKQTYNVAKDIKKYKKK
jgi:hypothetical protein